MSNVFIGIHQRWLGELTTALHQHGELEVMDLRTVSRKEISFPPPGVAREKIDSIINLQFKIDRVLEILQIYKPDEPGLLSSIIKPEEREYIPAYRGSHDDLLSEAEKKIQESEIILDTYEELKMVRDLSRTCEGHILDLERLKEIKIDLAFLNPAPFTFCIAGYVPVKFAKLLEEWSVDNQNDEILIFSENRNDEILVFCISTIEYAAILTELSHITWFTRIVFPDTFFGTAEEILEKQQGYFKEFLAKEDELTKKLQEFSLSYCTTLQALREELSFRRERFDISRKFGSSRNAVYMRGYVRQKDEKTLKALLRSITQDECFIQTEPADPQDNVPVRYDNPSWLKPFELLTTTFSRPRYNEIDPTPFFAPAYLLFFGLMLGDAGYGIIIALAGWLLYRGPGKNDPSFRDMSYILLCSGIADIILGTLQGGWFGDMLPRFFNIQPPFVLIEPLNSPILLFQVALIIGTVHINLGIILGLIENIRARMFKMAFQEQGIWFILQPAAAVLLVQFFGWMALPSHVTTMATAGAIIGVAVLFISKGPMGFFSLTGFLGDWLSYVRILALALATGGIAMTINILSEMIASVHPFMIIPAIIFCIAGQLFNLAIQTLGSVIHALRLHYIEFFGRFYSGGGREFVPFRENRVYTHANWEEML